MSQFVGRVVGTKMQKTAKVEVCRMFLHPHVLKVRFKNQSSISLLPSHFEYLTSQPSWFPFDSTAHAGVWVYSLLQLPLKNGLC